MKEKTGIALDDFYHERASPEVTKKRDHIKEKRIFLLGGLILVTFLLFDLFLWKMFRNIHQPFKNMIARSALLYPESEEQPTEEELTLQLKEQDTDYDGLSDYDELYVSSTSPYLEDSDSDGVKDNEEIQAGGDPNCGEADGCESRAPTKEEALAKLPTKFEKDVAESLRIALEKTGMPREQIDLFSDEDLMKMYQEVVYSMKQSGDAVAGAELKPEQLLNFEQLSPPEIRELLVKAGLDPTLIQTVSDEKLTDMYLESLGLKKEESAPTTLQPDIKIAPSATEETQKDEQEEEEQDE